MRAHARAHAHTHAHAGPEPKSARYGYGIPKEGTNYSGVIECPCTDNWAGSPEIYGAATPTKQLHHDYKAKAAAQCGVCASVRVGGWVGVCVRVRACVSAWRCVRVCRALDLSGRAGSDSTLDSAAECFAAVAQINVNHTVSNTTVSSATLPAGAHEYCTVRHYPCRD